MNYFQPMHSDLSFINIKPGQNILDRFIETFIYKKYIYIGFKYECSLHFQDKQADYGKVILPFTVLRRLDMILEPTKKKVLEAYQKHKAKKPEVLEPILNGIAKVKFHNHSKFDFIELAKDHNNIAANLRNYIK
jgi:hypothetical protein